MSSIPTLQCVPRCECPRDKLFNEATEVAEHHKVTFSGDICISGVGAKGGGSAWEGE